MGKVEVESKSIDELTRMERENRRFTILQRERAITEAQKEKNLAAIMTGACVLGAAAAVYFNGVDINVVLQHEMEAIHSWKALGQYIQDLGPATTVLAAGIVGFGNKYFKSAKNLKNLKNEMIDFDASLEQVDTAQVGDAENAKTR